MNPTPLSSEDQKAIEGLKNMLKDVISDFRRIYLNLQRNPCFAGHHDDFKNTLDQWHQVVQSAGSSPAESEPNKNDPRHHVIPDEGWAWKNPLTNEELFTENSALRREFASIKERNSRLVEWMKVMVNQLDAAGKTLPDRFPATRQRIELVVKEAKAAIEAEEKQP